MGGFPRRCAAFVAFALLTLHGTMAIAATVTLKPETKHQTILGWGGTAAKIDVPDALRQELLDEAVNDLGLTRLRLEPPGGNRAAVRRWEWDNDDGDPDSINWAALNTRALDEKADLWIKPFKQRVEANGDPFTLYISPSFFNGGSSGEAPAWLIHSPGEYAEYALSLILRLKDKHGVTATYYSICNEAGNGNAFSPQVVAAAIKALGPKLEALQLPTRIEFPECVNAGQSWRYIQFARDDEEVWRHVGLVTYHLYGSTAERPQIRDFAHARGIPTGQTEFMGTTINHLYDDLTEGGCSVWEHYVMAGWGNTTLSGCYVSANHNLTSFSRYPHYWQFRQVMHYVRPGAVRIEAASDDPALRPLAFIRDGKMTVVLLNTTPPHKTRTVALKGVPENVYRACYAAGNKPYEELGYKRVRAGQPLTLDVPANAVLTLYPFGPQYMPPAVTDWRATPNYLTAPKSATTLSASATDPDLQPLAFEWTVESQPAGARAALATPKAATTQASGLAVPGDYVFAITVSDPVQKTVRRVRLTVFKENQPPVVVDLHNRIPLVVTLPQSTTLLRGGGRDLEGDPLTYRWSIISQPQGAAAAIEDIPKKGQQLSNLTVAGDHVIRLEVSDPTHTVAESLTVHVYPPNKPPVITDAAASPARVLPPESKATLSAKTSDPDGDVITHWWTVQRAPAGAKPVFEKQGAPATAVSGLTVEGAYVFTLTAVDRTMPTRASVTVLVGKDATGAAPAPPKKKAQADVIVARGTLVGTVAATGPAWIEVKSEDGKTQRYIPEWRGGMPSDGGGPDPEVVKQIQTVKPGDRIRVRWHQDHHLRVEQIEPER